MNHLKPNRADGLQIVLQNDAIDQLQAEGYIINPYWELAHNIAYNRIHTPAYLRKIFYDGEEHQPTKQDYTPFGAFMGARLRVIKSLGVRVSEQVFDEVYEKAWVEWTQ